MEYQSRSMTAHIHIVIGVLSVIQCSFSLNLNCTTLATSCPTAAQWLDRGKMFNCTGNKRYICLMAPGNELREGCIFNSTIGNGQIGCPYTKQCDSRTGQPALVTSNNYLPCPPEDNGCPPRNHSGYSIFEIYKYARCQGRNASSKSSVTPNKVTGTPTTIIPSKVHRNKNLTAILTSTGVGVIIMFLTLILIVRRKKCIKCISTRKTHTIHDGCSWKSSEYPRGKTEMRKTVSTFTIISCTNSSAPSNAQPSTIYSIGIPSSPTVEDLDTTMDSELIYYYDKDIASMNKNSEKLRQTPSSTCSTNDSHGSQALMLPPSSRHQPIIQHHDASLHNNQNYPIKILGTPNGHDDTVGIPKNAKVNVTAITKDAPQHKVGSNCHNDTVKMRNDAKVDVNANISYQDTSPNNEASIGYQDTMKTRIDAKVDIYANNWVSVNKITPQLEATQIGKTKTVVDAKANINDMNCVFRVPRDITRVGVDATELFLKSVSEDAVPVNVVRCVFVGHFGAGKTTLVNSLLGKPRTKTRSTNCVELYINKIFANKNSREWHIQDEDTERIIRLEDFIQIDIWDLAEQMVFYAICHTYPSSRCIFPIVFNACFGLDGKVQNGRGKSFVKDYIEFWVKTITTYVQGDVDGFPKIAIVGTHIDQLSDPSTIPKLIQEIKMKFQSLVKSGQLIVREDLFINASNMDAETTEKIREMMLSCGKSYPEYGIMIPRSWKDLLERLIQRKSEKVIAFEEVEHINHQMEKPLNETEIRLCMSHLHSLGYLLFFPEEELKDHILLDLSYIINTMKCFFNRSQFISQVSERNEWLKQGYKGKIKFPRLDEMLQQSISDDRHRRYLHRVMKQLDLICEPKVYNAEGFEKNPDYYYIPCMIHRDIATDTLSLIENEKAVLLAFRFDTVIPPAVYNRLVACSLSLWPVFQEHTYNGLIILRSGLLHIIAFRLQKNQINVSMVHLEDQEKINAYLCRMIVQFAEEILSGILPICNTSTKQTKESKLLFQVTCRSAAAKGLLETRNKEGIEDEQDDVCDERCKSDLRQETSYVVDDLFLMRVALRIKVSDIYTLAAKVCKHKTVDDMQSNYPELRKSDIAWLILMEWSRQNEKRTPKLKELQYVLNESGISPHILCKVMRQKNEHPLFLHPAFQNSNAYSELLHAVADRISRDYIHVGLELGLKADTILKIRMDFKHQIVKLTRAILQVWYDKNKEKDCVKVLKLATALLNAKCDISVLQEFEKQRFYVTNTQKAKQEMGRNY